MGRFLTAFYRKLFARVAFRRLNRLIYQMGLHGLGMLNYESDRLSGELHFLRHYVPAMGGGVILDVGANAGHYAKSLRALNTGLVIHCFEPHPATYLKLRENVAQLDIQTHNSAVGSEPGTLTLYDYADQDGSEHASLYKEVIEKIHKGAAVAHPVKLITLDAFAAEHAITRVSLLKIDTEGHEIEVLKGFARFIEERRVDIIHFEFNEMNIASRVFFKDFWETLANYDLYRMLPDGLLPIKEYSPAFCEIYAYQNIVAILKPSSSPPDA